MRITKTALRFKTSVYVLLLIIVLVGVQSYRTLPLESAPDVDIPIILVHTVYPGVAPADMETLVTNVVERELKDLRNVKRITSSSAESISAITIEFESGVDMDDAYQKTRDQVDKAKVDLPTGAEDPALTEITISDFPIMLVNVYGSTDLVRLKQIAEGLEDQIEAIPGVLDVDLTGGLEREIQVELNPERLEFYGIGVGQVIGSIQREHLNIPGGKIELGDSKYLVRVDGEYRDPKLMEQIVLKAPKGAPIKLADVGQVIDGFADRKTISRVDGQECVTLRVQKRAGENIVRIADDVRVLLADAEGTLPAGVGTLVRQDMSVEIREMVSDLENSVITGLLLVLAVLFFFMGLRNAAFVAIAIPVSLLITMSVLAALGITLNMVVLFSLILALGMLVDNSIVVVENIFRHASEGGSRLKAAYEGTKEVAWPIIASTATTVAVFLPLLFWPGIMGEFMSFLPKTVIVSLLASLFVALVINPVVAATFLRSGDKMFDDSGEVKGGAMRLYKRVLSWSLGHPKTLVAASNLLLVGMIAAYGALGAGLEFFPDTTPERVQVKIKAPVGTQLAKTDELARAAERIAATEDNVENVVTNVGFGGGMSGGGGDSSSHRAVIDVEFKDRHARTHSTWDTIESLREKMSKLAGAEFRVEVEVQGPPTGRPLEVQVQGEDYAELDRLASEASKLLATIPGVVDLTDDYDAGAPEVRIAVDREKAMQRKVNTLSVARAVSTAVQGTEAGKFREGDEEYDIMVRYDRDYRSSINDLLDLKVTGNDDVQIPLRDVADVETRGGLGTISHVDHKRTIRVSSDVVGRGSPEVAMDAKRLLDEELPMPPGYALSFAGENEEQEKASAFLSKAFGLGLLLLALILITQFNSVLRPSIILGSVVFSAIGVLLGLLVTGNKFGIIMTGMGLISLAGVVVNNAIVLIDYINQLREKHGLGLTEALLQAGVIRFRPVMMTAITTVLGMLPMALGVKIDFANLSVDVGGTSGEWWGPMAQAVIFGLLFATLLTLVMVPVMYLVLERFTDWSRRWSRWAADMPSVAWRKLLDRKPRATNS